MTTPHWTCRYCGGTWSSIRTVDQTACRVRPVVGFHLGKRPAEDRPLRCEPEPGDAHLPGSTPPDGPQTWDEMPGRPKST